MCAYLKNVDMRCRSSVIGLGSALGSLDLYRSPPYPVSQTLMVPTRSRNVPMYP